MLVVIKMLISVIMRIQYVFRGYPGVGEQTGTGGRLLYSMVGFAV